MENIISIILGLYLVIVFWRVREQRAIKIILVLGGVLIGVGIAYGALKI